MNDGELRIELVKFKTQKIFDGDLDSVPDNSQDRI